MPTYLWVIDSIKGLKVIHLNIRSLATKIDLLRVWVALHKPNIITISESWLHNKITNDEVGIDNDVLYTADRATECVSPNVAPTNFECLFTNIIFHENKQLTIGNIYRPPSAPTDSLNGIWLLLILLTDTMNWSYWVTLIITGWIGLSQVMEIFSVV